jgi:hypothetical protein
MARAALPGLSTYWVGCERVSLAGRRFAGNSKACTKGVVFGNDRVIGRALTLCRCG